MTNLNSSTDQCKVKLKRCAVYARYSSDLQRPSSIEDQARKCRQECERHEGWVIDEQWVVSDEEVSGTSLAGRKAMDSLIRAAKSKPRPFDCILIDDTSRFGRNLSDVLRLAKVFEHYGVSLQFVSPQLSSTDPNFNILLTFKGMLDEQYSIDLAHKVRRGQEGRVLAGYNAGGPCYGYCNGPVLTTDGKREIGVPLVKIPEQEKVVRRIFEMYANSSSLERIARSLRADGITPPRPPRKNSVCGWSADGIAEILRNKKYIGINERGRTTSVRNPETGRSETREVPEGQWVRKENPEWRIVSDELWNKVQAQLALKKKLGIPKQGGLNRTKRSEKYLFSGLLSCGICRGPIRIVDGTVGGEIVRYGCGAHRYKGACTNAVTIRRDSLEEQLLRWLTRDLFHGEQLEQAANSLHARVAKRLTELQAEARKNAVNAPELRKELDRKKQEAANIAEAIATMGLNCSPTLQTRLLATESRIRELEELLRQAREPEPINGFCAGEIKTQILNKLGDIQAELTNSPQIGKQILQRHIRRITLTPAEAEGKRVLQVAVEFEFGGGGSSAVLLTGGVELYRQQYGLPPVIIQGLQLNTGRVLRSGVKSKEPPTSERQKLAAGEHVRLEGNVNPPCSALEVPASQDPQAVNCGG